MQSRECGDVGWGVTVRSLTRRGLIGAGTAATGAALLAACGGRAPGTAPGAGTSKSPVTIRLGERAGTEAQAFDNRLPAFKEKYPHVTVVRETITGDMIAVLQTMQVSNTMPDNAHAYTGGQQYHSFAIGGALRNIESLIARDKLDLKGWFPEMIEIMRVDGKLFGLPFKGQVLATGFYYNADLFQSRGVAPPNENWTLDDLIKAAQQFTVRSGADTVQWGYAVNTWGGENFVPHVRQWGGDSFSRDGKKATMDTPQVLEALQWYETMFHRERILHPLANASPSFIEGKVAMIGRTYLNYKTTHLPQVGLPQGGGKFRWDGMMQPKHPRSGKRGGMFAGDSHAVSRDSKNPEAAFELLKWITDKEFGVQLGLQTKGSTTLGGRPDVYADERILNHSQLTRQMQLAQMNSVNQIKEPSSAPANIRAAEVYKVRDDATTKIANGQVKAEPGFLKQLNAEMQAILDLPRP